VAKRTAPPRYKALTLERAREAFRYDPITGILRWQIDVQCGRGRVKMHAGDRAGGKRTVGYRYVTIDGLQIMEHVLIWFLVQGEWPADRIDHENTRRDDNRWTNLRPATHAENMRNAGARRTSSTGLKGVIRHQSGKFQARCSGVFLGTFDTPEAAHAAYAAYARKEHGPFFNPGSRAPSPGARL
jgi:hypothetical protein